MLFPSPLCCRQLLAAGQSPRFLKDFSPGSSSFFPSDTCLNSVWFILSSIKISFLFSQSLNFLSSKALFYASSTIYSYSLGNPPPKSDVPSITCFKHHTLSLMPVLNSLPVSFTLSYSVFRNHYIPSTPMIHLTLVANNSSGPGFPLYLAYIL